MPIYLERANSDLVCWCKCETSLVSSPAQMDCPWCGCGWLFTCINCGKAFTFARGVELDLSLADLAKQDLTRMYKKPPDEEAIQNWIEGMEIMLGGVQVGKIYCYFDGWYLPVDQADYNIEGWFARHKFAALPQVEAKRDPKALSETIASIQYWRERAITRSDEAAGTQ